MHGPDPAQVGERPPLAVGNRDEWKIRIMAIKPLQVLDVLPAVQGGQRPVGQVVEQGEVVAVEMKMKNVELVGHLPHGGKHGEMRRQVPGLLLVQPQGDVPAGHELRPGLAVAAREQRDVMPALDQSIGKMSHNTLRPAVEFRRDGFVKGSDLSDTHRLTVKNTDLDQQRAEPGPVPDLGDQAVR
jgi:hypothetical protein